MRAVILYCVMSNLAGPIMSFFADEKAEKPRIYCRPRHRRHLASRARWHRVATGRASALIAVRDGATTRLALARSIIAH